MLSLTAFADELEREKARQRTYDAMLRKARLGHVTGGRVFGYDNVRQDTGGVRRVINDAEAAVVREIFTRCARGQGRRVIALALNAAGSPSPRSQQARPQGWCSSSVREVLHRPLYRGEIVWNKTRKRNTWGQQEPQNRPESEWLRLPAPDLRIVTDETWDAAHERLQASRGTYLRHTDGRVWGKPTDGLESKYLLRTGLAQCAVCGGGLYVTSRSHGRQRAFFYACTTFHRKGHTVCANNRQIAMEAADWAVMEAVQDELLDPGVVAQAVWEAAGTLVQAPPDFTARLEALVAREATLTAITGRLTAAISAGGELTPLVTELKAREQERERLQTERRQIETIAHATPDDFTEVERVLLERVKDWRAAANPNIAQARQVLRKLLRGRVLITPKPDGTCELSGQADYGKLFSGIPLACEITGRGDTRSLFLSLKTLDWRPDDELRAKAVDHLAPQAAAGGHERRKCHAHLPTFRHFPKNVLQVAAVSGARRYRIGGPGPGAAPLPTGDAVRGRE
jgi:Recombinase/Recombinase zinc beta ribbon domain